MQNAHIFKPEHQTQCWWNLGISRVGPAARPGRLLLFTLRECTLHLALHLALCFALCLLLHLALCLALHLALCLGEQDCVHIAHELDISYCTWHRGTIVSTPVGRHVSLIWEPASLGVWSSCNWTQLEGFHRKWLFSKYYQAPLYQENGIIETLSTEGRFPCWQLLGSFPTVVGLLQQEMDGLLPNICTGRSRKDFWGGGWLLSNYYGAALQQVLGGWGRLGRLWTLAPTWSPHMALPLAHYSHADQSHPLCSKQSN